ncbi:MAG: methionine biosynthesis protein MetW [Planctomycetota bacterium]|nr:methionine biosynthesis protein MetW [Planctomycetota bacterium]
MKADQKNMRKATVRQLVTLVQSKMDPALLGVAAGKFAEFLTQVGSSAPDPDAARHPQRWQDGIIEQQIPPGASVLDLGCGSGVLLTRLIEIKQVRGQGVELDPIEVMKCVERGVPVFQADLDEGLQGFPDKGFDYVVLEETLQTLRRPREVLREMMRVGRRGIVSFPNFGYWRVRLDLGVRGRMPVTARLPYRWYDTPNIHLFTVQDFVDWAEEDHFRIAAGYALAEGQIREIQVSDNLYAEEALFIIESA